MANSILKQYFPVLRTKHEILMEITQKPWLDRLYKSWEPWQQEEFLNFCSGMKGCKVLYDAFFKQVMDPEKTPERLENFLTLLLKKKVKILQVLPNESRVAVENSLVIMDIVVKLEDGSIADVEMQRQGYAFPGERSSCYSADLLLRQYQRVKSEALAKGGKFTYRDIKKVYTIVLFEKSPMECKALPDDYIHFGKVRFDTGLELDLPQEFFYITLDIYRTILHNRGISNIANDLDAWLTFLCEDDPEVIVSLFTQYPFFKPLYDDIYKLCESMEGIMDCYTEMLLEFDKNTAQYMIEEQQGTIEEQKAKIVEQLGTISEQREQLEEQEGTISEQREQLEEQEGTISEQREQLEEQEGTISEQREQLEEQKGTITEQQTIICEMKAEKEQTKAELDRMNARIAELERMVAARGDKD